MIQEIRVDIHRPGNIDEQDEEDAERDPFPLLQRDPTEDGPIHEGPREI